MWNISWSVDLRKEMVVRKIHQKVKARAEMLNQFFTSTFITGRRRVPALAASHTVSLRSY